jgi:2',5'-phosphodiesterase
MSESWKRTVVGPIVLVKAREVDDIIMSFFLRGKQVNFVRKRSDIADTVINRMKLTCSRIIQQAEGIPGPGKKRKGDPSQKESSTPELPVYFTNEAGAHVDSTQSFHDLLMQSKYLFVNDLSYMLALNPPQPVHLSVFQPLIQDCPVLYRLEVENGAPSDLVIDFAFGEKSTLSEICIPDQDDVGKLLKLTALNEAFPEFHISCDATDPVLPYPAEHFPCSIDSRLADTLPGQIRLCTFNILAQAYVTTGLATRVMYAHITDPTYLSFAYRNGLIFKELLNFNGDLLLLQEVAPQVVERCLTPLLGKTHDVTFVGKENSQRPNGVSIVSSRRKFKQVLTQDVVLGGAGLWAHFNEAEKALISESFGTTFVEGVLPNLSTVASIAILKSYEGQVVIVANTHLFYHPLGAHVRLMQVVALVRIIEGYLTDYPTAQVVLGGDMNSRPDTAAIRFLLTGRVGADDTDWQYGTVFAWGREAGEESEEDTEPIAVVRDPFCKGIDASHSLKLKLSWKEAPELTHATAGFRAVLDYIIVSDSVKLIDDFPDRQLTHSAVDRFGGLPCAAYGSDHVLVAADISI